MIFSAGRHKYDGKPILNQGQPPKLIVSKRHEGMSWQVRAGSYKAMDGHPAMQKFRVEFPDSFILLLSQSKEASFLRGA